MPLQAVWEPELHRKRWWKPVNTTMPCWPRRQAQTWWVLLFLLVFLLLLTHAWCTKEENYLSDQKTIEEYFPATMEYALHTFNLQSRDTHASRLLRILSAWKEQVERKKDYMLAFSMELELGQTRCRKFEEDIDNCPFQERPEVSNGRHRVTFHCFFTFSCFFTISTQPWRTKFDLLNSTCEECIPDS
ncbi:cystatin-9-like [Orycteropus afer afer]|uniref:Cystatin-9-like n=1 Tax=Orycteropus afer afer TaxID=1230840 RepID=A0AC54ZBC3_ORYAF|nr:cystatin-9-like [Orycteropus afer afer]